MRSGSVRPVPPTGVPPREPTFSQRVGAPLNDGQSLDNPARPEPLRMIGYFFVADHAAPALVVPFIIFPSTRPVYFVLPTENSI